MVLPFPIWRDAFINDADAATAQKAYDILNPHPEKTFSDKISLKTNPADMQVAKSYVNCTEDTALPHHHGWHPRLSQKQVCSGWFRFRAATSSASQIRSYWRKPSWMRDETDPDQSNHRVRPLADRTQTQPGVRRRTSWTSATSH